MQWACAILSPVVFLIRKYFSTLSHTWQDFKKNTYEMCVLIFLNLLSEPFFMIRINSEISWKSFIRLHLKYLLFLPDFNETGIFWTIKKKTSRISNCYPKI